MTTPTIVSEQPLSIYDVRKELKAIKKRDETLSIRAQRCDEYVTQFATMSDKSAEELKEKLEKLDIPRARPEHIYKIIDILPTTADDVKQVLSGFNITVKAELCQKIAELCTEFSK
jgi:DNA-directed RNA polymerase subunit F